jgi:hypothetical protein
MAVIVNGVHDSRRRRRRGRGRESLTPAKKSFHPQIYHAPHPIISTTTCLSSVFIYLSSVELSLRFRKRLNMKSVAVWAVWQFSGGVKQPISSCRVCPKKMWSAWNPQSRRYKGKYIPQSSFHFTLILFYFIINIFSSIQIGKRLCSPREVVQSAGHYASTISPLQGEIYSVELLSLHTYFILLLTYSHLYK